MNNTDQGVTSPARENKLFEIACLVISFLIILPLFIIGIYGRPSIDDYNYSIYAHYALENGGNLWDVLEAAWNTDMEFYNNWQGLYTSAFLLALQPAIWGEQFYALTIFIVLLSIYAFIFLSVHILNKSFLQKSLLFSFTASTVLLAMLVLWLPSAVQGLFWYNGAMNYTPWVFTNFFNICLLYHVSKNLKSKKSIALIVLSTVLSFLTSGGNHVTAFANILFLLFISIEFIFRKKQYHTLAPLVAACIGFVIMYNAPGTAYRASFFTRPSVFVTVVATAGRFAMHLFQWIDLQWLLSIVVITPIAFQIALKNKDKLPRRFPFFTIILSGVVLCGMIAVPFYSMGWFGEGRLTNVVYLTFLILSWYCYVLIIGFLVKRNIIKTDKILSKKHVGLVCTIVVCIALVLMFMLPGDIGASNSLEAIYELKDGRAQAYAEVMDSRFAILNDPNVEVAYLRPLSNTPQLLCFSDISHNPDEWTNSALANYYHKKRVYLLD